MRGSWDKDRPQIRSELSVELVANAKSPSGDKSGAAINHRSPDQIYQRQELPAK